ncbi:unnamed protein product, partial [Symbiodinium sp. KB8]
MSLDYTRRESQAWVKLSREGYYNVKSGSYRRVDGQETQEGAPEPSSAQALYEASRAKRLAKHKQLASGASALVLPQHASHRFYAEGGEEGHSVFLDFPQRSDARSGGAQGASPASSSSEGEGKAVARVPFSQGDADARNANVLRQYASQVEERWDPDAPRTLAEWRALHGSGRSSAVPAPPGSPAARQPGQGRGGLGSPSSARSSQGGTQPPPPPPPGAPPASSDDDLFARAKALVGGGGDPEGGEWLPASDALGTTGRYPLIGTSSTALHTSPLERKVDKEAAFADLRDSTLPPSLQPRPASARRQANPTVAGPAAAANSPQRRQQSTRASLSVSCVNHLDDEAPTRLAPPPLPGMQPTQYHPEHDPALLHFMSSSLPMSPPAMARSAGASPHLPATGQALSDHAATLAATGEHFQPTATTRHREWLADLHATLVDKGTGEEWVQARGGRGDPALATAMAALPSSALPPLPQGPQSMAHHPEFSADYLATHPKRVAEDTAAAHRRDWLTDLGAAPPGSDRPDTMADAVHRSRMEAAAAQAGLGSGPGGSKAGPRRPAGPLVGSSVPAHAWGDASVYDMDVPDATVAAAQARIAVLWDDPAGMEFGAGEDEPPAGWTDMLCPNTGCRMFRQGTGDGARYVAVTPQVRKGVVAIQALFRGYNVRSLLADQVGPAILAVRQDMARKRAATKLGALWRAHAVRRATARFVAAKAAKRAAGRGADAAKHQAHLAEARARREQLALESEAARDAERLKAERKRLAETSDRIDRHGQYVDKLRQAGGARGRAGRTASVTSIDFDALEERATAQGRRRVATMEVLDFAGLGRGDGSISSSASPPLPPGSPVRGRLDSDLVSEADLPPTPHLGPRNSSGDGGTPSWEEEGSDEEEGVGQSIVVSRVDLGGRRPPPPPRRRSMLGKAASSSDAKVDVISTTLATYATEGVSVQRVKAAAVKLQRSARALLAQRAELRAAAEAAAKAEAAAAAEAKARRDAEAARQRIQAKYEARVRAKRAAAVVVMQRLGRGWLARREAAARRHLAWRSSMRQPTVGNLSRLFKWIDADGDGELSVTEFTRAGRGKRTIGSRSHAHMTGMQPGLSGRGKRGVNLLALDNKGSKGQKPKVILSSRDQMRLFQHADVDGDGVLSQVEFLAAFDGTRDPVFLDWMQAVLIRLAEAEANPASMTEEELNALKAQAAVQAMQLRSRLRRRKLRLAAMWRMMAPGKDLQAQLALFQRLDQSQQSQLTYAAFISGLTELKDELFDQWMDAMFRSAAAGRASHTARMDSVARHQAQAERRRIKHDPKQLQSAWKDVMASVADGRKVLRSTKGKGGAKKSKGGGSPGTPPSPPPRTEVTPPAAPPAAPARRFQRQNTAKDLEAVMSAEVSAAAIADALMQPLRVGGGPEGGATPPTRPPPPDASPEPEAVPSVAAASGVTPATAAVATGKSPSAPAPVSAPGRGGRMASVSTARLPQPSAMQSTLATVSVPSTHSSHRDSAGGGDSSDDDSTATLTTPSPREGLEDVDLGPPPALAPAYDDDESPEETPSPAPTGGPTTPPLVSKAAERGRMESVSNAKLSTAPAVPAGVTGATLAHVAEEPAPSLPRPHASKAPSLAQRGRMESVSNAKLASLTAGGGQGSASGPLATTLTAVGEEEEEVGVEGRGVDGGGKGT